MLSSSGRPNVTDSLFGGTVAFEGGGMANCSSSLSPPDKRGAVSIHGMQSFGQFYNEIGNP